MIFGICGRLESGKDTAGRHLVERYGFVRYAFADRLKELCNYVIDRAQIGWTGTDWTGPKTERGRMILQGIGHGAREVIGRDVWTDAMTTAVLRKGDESRDLVVTDVRYPNEARWVIERGGLMVRLVRPEVDRSGPEHQHPTETAIDTLPVHLEIVNDRSIEALQASLDTLVGCADLIVAGGLTLPHRTPPGVITT